MFNWFKNLIRKVQINLAIRFNKPEFMPVMAGGATTFSTLSADAVT